MDAEVTVGLTSYYIQYYIPYRVQYRKFRLDGEFLFVQEACEISQFYITSNPATKQPFLDRSRRIEKSLPDLFNHQGLALDVGNRKALLNARRLAALETGRIDNVQAFGLRHAGVLFPS